MWFERKTQDKGSNTYKDMFVVCIRKGEQIRDGTLIGFLKLNLITHVCTVCVCVGLCVYVCANE